MRCQSCGKEDTKVLESRLSADGRCIRRRRACLSCQYRFTTYEKEEILALHIKKKNESVEPYQRDKILRSIQIACQKRPIKIEEIEFLLGKIEARLHELGDRVVSSSLLGDYVMEGLLELDHVAYVRFASVYKDFQNTGEFYALLRNFS